MSRITSRRLAGRVDQSHLYQKGGQRERLGLSDLRAERRLRRSAGLKGQYRDGEYSMADMGLSTFSVFFRAVHRLRP